MKYFNVNQFDPRDTRGPYLDLHNVDEIIEKEASDLPPGYKEEFMDTVQMEHENKPQENIHA